MQMEHILPVRTLRSDGVKACAIGIIAGFGVCTGCNR